MPAVSSASALESSGVSRALVVALFVSSILLSIVSWYTTQQGMALYLSGWFSTLAAAGLQSALVLTAWLIGFTRRRRGLLIAVYCLSGIVSVAFSYVSLYTWFTARERPAQVQRQLYDTLTAAAAKAEEPLSAAIAEAKKHALALDELADGERTHGYLSRAEDADPYLSELRQSVAGEGRAIREGSGAGPRYTAFDRYAKLARQSAAQLESTHQALAGMRAQLRPTDPAEKQLRSFHAVFDTLPWVEMETQLHRGKLERPAVPGFAEFVDQTSGGQEDLLQAFQGLVATPTYKHIFALALATFIDLIVFFLAYASGPHFHGAPETRWTAAAAAMEATDRQLFVRDFLRKLTPTAQGLARVEASQLTPGEQQFCLLLAGNDLATPVEEEGRVVYLLDNQIHESLMDNLSHQGRAFRAAARPAAAS